MKFKTVIWPLEEKRHTFTLPLTHGDHFNVLQYILAAQTYTDRHTHTLNTDRVIQSVKSIRRLAAGEGAWPRGSTTRKRRRPCAEVREGAIQ